MLRTCFHRLNRPSSLKVLKILWCDLQTSQWSYSYSKEKQVVNGSVLVAPEIRKPVPPEKYGLGSVLTIQQSETLNTIQKLSNADQILHFLKDSDLIVPLYAPLFLQINELIRANKFDMKIEEFVHSHEFEIFCKKVQKSARAIRPSDIINILKTLKALKVSTNSLLSQTLLHVLSKCINELYVVQITFLSYLLRGAPSSPIVDALKIASPIVFDANVRIKLNHDDPRAVFDAFRYAASVKISDASFDILVDSVMKHRDRYHIYQIKDIMISILSTKKLDDLRKELYRFCLTKVNKRMIEKLSLDDIIILTSKMIDGFLFIDSYLYDENFMSNVVEYLLTKNLSFLECGKILRIFNRISYVNVNLLDYMDKMLRETKVSDYDKTAIISYISSCSDALYKPSNWMTYENNMVNFLKNIDMTSLPILRSVLELITLNCWSPQLINSVFEEDFLRTYLNRENNFIDNLVLLNLYQVVKTLFPGKYDGNLPPQDLLENAKKCKFELERDIVLQPSLEMLFGGDNFVVNGLKTKLHHFIDHLIIIRKDGQTHPLRENGIQDGQILEDIVFPRGSYPFAIIILNPTAYCIDGIKLRGKYQYYLESLETFGVITVPISSITWESIQDREKLPYIKREIFSRIPAVDNSETFAD